MPCARLHCRSAMPSGSTRRSPLGSRRRRDLSICGMERPVAASSAARSLGDVPHPLDIDAMNAAARDLLGDHDFSSFCRRPKPADGMIEPSLVRRLQVARWDRAQEAAWGPGDAPVRDQRHVVLSPDGAQHRRDARRGGSWTASCRLDVGHTAALDRSAAGPVAPPTGLVLFAVDYSGERWDS